MVCVFILLLLLLLLFYNSITSATRNLQYIDCEKKRKTKGDHRVNKKDPIALSKAGDGVRESMLTRISNCKRIRITMMEKSLSFFLYENQLGVVC